MSWFKILHWVEEKHLFFLFGQSLINLFSFFHVFNKHKERTIGNEEKFLRVKMSLDRNKASRISLSEQSKRL